MKDINTNIDKNTNEVAVKLVLTADDWSIFLKKARLDAFNALEVKGFRKGKVPEAMANNLIKQDQVRSSALNSAIDKHFKEVSDFIFKNDVITQPSLAIIKLTDEILEVEFRSKLFPEIKLGDLSKITLSYQPPEMTTEDLKQLDDEVVKMFTKKSHLTEGTVKNDDLVDINFVGKIAGVPFDKGSGEHFELKIGSKSFIDNFETQLIGKTVGSESTISVKFPDVYPEEALKGKIADFDVKINAIIVDEQSSDAEITEQLNKEGFASFDEYFQQYVKSAKQKKTLEYNENYFNDFVTELQSLEGTEINIPKELLDQQVKTTIEGFKHQLEHQSMKYSDYLKMVDMTEEEFIKQNIIPNVNHEITIGLIYSQLLKQFEIKINEQEIETEYNNIAIENKLSLEETKKEISSNDLKNSLMFKKIIERIKK